MVSAASSSHCVRGSWVVLEVLCGREGWRAVSCRARECSGVSGVQECRAFELLRGQADRVNYLGTKHAKIVAMTCTHAALKRREFLKLGFRYDTLVMEESAQILEIETFIPMLLQQPQDGRNRLKRVRPLLLLLHATAATTVPRRSCCFPLHMHARHVW